MAIVGRRVLGAQNQKLQLHIAYDAFNSAMFVEFGFGFWALGLGWFRIQGFGSGGLRLGVLRSMEDSEMEGSFSSGYVNPVPA